MSEHWQPSARVWVIGSVISLAAFTGFAIAEGLASGFQFLAIILFVDALLLLIFDLIHRVK
jgi:predicted Co/Zn/Cd cation transporter (cation efflux family)